MKYWAIEAENFEGFSEVFYFENYEIARANFERLFERYKEYDEFYAEDDDYCEWFDPTYNEYKTTIYLTQARVLVRNEIIF